MPSGAKSKDAAHVERVQGVYALKATHPVVRRLKREQGGFDLHGNKVWEASFVLMDFLRRFPPPEQAAMMDLGCGWGVMSCFLAKQFDADVTGVDADANVEAFYQLHAEMNGVAPRFEQRRFEALRKPQLAPIDMIVGSDICFWDDMVDPLKRLFRRAIRQDVARICLADPGRDPFWQLTEYCRKHWPAEVYHHSIRSPRKTTHYILEIEL